MTRLVRCGAAGLTALLLLLGPTACGGDDEGSTDSSDTGADTDAGGDDTGGDDAPDDGGDDAEPAEGPAGGVVFTDLTDTPAATVVINEGGFSPGDVTVSVGDVVQFTTDDDGIYGVIVGDLDGYTVTGGLDEAFLFEQPGSYPVREDISGAEATITVE